MRRLAKSFPSVGDDVTAAYQALSTVRDRGPYNPPQVSLVPGFGRELLKVRVASSDQKKGKSGGFRMVLLRVGAGWRPVAIFAKVQAEDFAHHDLLRRLAEEDASDGEPSPSPPAATE